ncbi:MAG: N-acetylglucosamine-6-phosphate deacetylase [Microthrixaceae bacterium]
MRLGVDAALVDGRVVAGDVAVDRRSGTIEAVGLDSPGDGGPPGPHPGTTIAVAGFVDLQVNGIGGVEFRSCGPEGYATAAGVLAAHGAVAVQPTFFSCSVEEYRAALRLLDGVAGAPPPGCRFLPAHLEGPFLNPTWVGAHEPATFLPPDPGVLAQLLDAGPIGFMTVAPELPGGTVLVADLCAAGVTVSVGHSDADSGQVRAAVDAGARHLTHCWNAHRRFAPREPGPAGVALADRRVTVGLIADGVHVAADTVRLTMAAAAGRVAATTDAIPPAGMVPTADGATAWTEHGREVRVADGAARLADGTLAGSVATPDAVLRHLVAVGCGLEAAVDACGGAQRRLLGLPELRLRAGDPADVTVLRADDLTVVRTLVAGTEVHAV